MQHIIAKYPPQQIFVLTDEHIAPLLPSLGLEAYATLVLPSGEANKTLESVERIWDFLLSHQATRHALLINVGGGVITDMGGFAAATYKRGIDFMNVPTSLLAMVDAGSGGKTGFDYHGIKNAIGVFRQPLETVIEPHVLRTLPIREILSGLAEMVKHALIGSEEEFSKLMAYDSESDFSSTDFGERIHASIAIKDGIVEADPEEHGLRKTLNFGHTIGHAIEALSLEKNPKNALTHGHAVMYGLIAELYLSHIRLGLDTKVITLLTHFAIENYSRIQISCRDYDRLIALMRQDKKNETAESINFTLLSRIGEPHIDCTATEDEIREALDYLFSA